MRSRRRMDVNAAARSSSAREEAKPRVIQYKNLKNPFRRQNASVGGLEVSRQNGTPNRSREGGKGKRKHQTKEALKKQEVRDLYGRICFRSLSLSKNLVE